MCSGGQPSIEVVALLGPDPRCTIRSRRSAARWAARRLALVKASRVESASTASGSARSRTPRTPGSARSTRGPRRCSSAAGGSCPTACRWPGWSAATTTCRCGSPRATGARFTDVDGHEYRDFNIADLSMFCGYAPEPLVRGRERPDGARQPVPAPGRGRDRRVARSSAAGSGCRSGSTRCSASQANTEAIRVARVATGRDKVLMFDGKYHGHLDEALVELDEDGRLVAEERGRPARHRRRHGARAVQRPGGAGARPRAARHRRRADRARDHEQHRPPAARRRASTPSCGA